MNPYQILGLNNTASVEEIRVRYKELMEEYTAQQDEDTQSKIALLNQAYNYLAGDNVYREIRAYIDQKNFMAADNRLSMINDRENAEWNYLQGFISVQKGWFETGLNYLRKAVELDPDNTEYASSLNTLQSRIIEYATRYATKRVRPNSNNVNGCGGGNNNGGMC